MNPVGGSNAAIGLEVSTADAGGIQKVEFWENIARLSSQQTSAPVPNSRLLATDTAAPYRLEFSYSDNGRRDLFVKVFDTAGNVATSQTLTITINIPAPPPAADTQAPTAPSLLIGYGATTGNTMTVAPGFTYNLQASGSTDNVGVIRVEFYQRNGTRTLAIDELTQAPFTLFRQETCLGTGSYNVSYTARAFDAAGNASPYSADVVVSYVCGK
ncbi:MAG: hypothetical protein SFU83_21215 [Meiothermus sp.]|nr:hypothetical protein [Meiothermus sp.]